MGVHYFSVLGTSLYEPVVYQFPEQVKEKKEQEFVQIAMLEELPELLCEDGKISIFLTQSAREKNWNDRQYTERDVAFAQRWISDRKQSVCEGQRKRGMKSILQEEYPQLYARTREIAICDASTEEQIWSVFETIYNTIEEGDEIYFDITHSFRSIPMLALTIINYARVLKNCRLRGIYYGAYEAADQIEHVKYAPIVDLTMYNEILEWSNAAEVFMQYGIAAKMEELYREKEQGLPGEKKREWSPIRDKVKAMGNLSLALFTCRGYGVSKAGQKMNKKKQCERSIKCAYQYFAEKNTEESKARAKDIKPLYPLLDKIEEQYQLYFDKESNYEIGLSVIEWSIQNEMVQQGYTALEETIKTYLCACYGLDDGTEKTRDRIVGRMLTGISRYLENKSSKEKEAFEADRANAVEEICKCETESREIKERIICTVPKDFVELCSQVKEKRNDINHFGFRDNPATSKSLIKDLKTYYKQFSDDIQKYPLEDGSIWWVN